MDKNSIAIIGAAIRFPQANSLNELWEGLVNGQDYICPIPEQRKADVEDYYQYAYGQLPQNIPPAAYLVQIDQFDYKYFGVTQKEAIYIEPAHRIFMETAIHCLKDAGYMGKKIQNSNTGVFVGYGGDYEFQQIISFIDKDNKNAHAIGVLSSFITSRLSYLFNLKGPAMAIDTSCSSSLVALHTACQSIRLNECDMALVGGAQIYSVPVQNGDIGVRSTDYKTRSFDDSADGTGSGEGVCALLIKSAHKAIADNDHIYAIIKGSAINSDGNAISITSPNPDAQKNVIISAWENANIDPRSVTYIEAHGTGTRLGDPIELDALTQAFKVHTKDKGFCAVSSIKSNIGHLGYCAGLAGVMRAVLQFVHHKYTPTVHFSKLNRNINLDDSALYVSEKVLDWNAADYPRRCGVSSFGISGTNCHVVLEEAPKCDDAKKSRPITLLGLPNKSSRCWFDYNSNSSTMLSIINSNYTTTLKKLLGFDINDSHSLKKAIISFVLCKHLGCESIGAEDNLYELGGNSIIALQAFGDLKEIFSIIISPEDFLYYQSVNEIMELVT